MSDQDNRNQSLPRRVNEQIRVASPDGSTEPIPFFCECRSTCFHAVWLSAAGYDALTRVRDALLLVPGHEPEGGEHAVRGGDLALAVA